MTVHMTSSNVCKRAWGIFGPDKSLTDINNSTKHDSVVGEKLEKSSVTLKQTFWETYFLIMNFCEWTYQYA